MVRGQAADHLDAWRLPAIRFEAQIAALMADCLTIAVQLAQLIPTISVGAMQKISERTEKLRSGSTETMLQLLAHIHLGSQTIRIALDAEANVAPDKLDATKLSWTETLTLRKRGVETRLIIGTEEAEIDHNLLANIRLARHWHQENIAGKTYATLAAEAKTDRSRIKDIIALAVLAPEILTQIASGQQPAWFNSAWVCKNDFPAD